MGVYGELLICCRNRLKFRLGVRLKPSNNRGEFELDRTRSKNNIAEKSFALGHETHNSYSTAHYQVDVFSGYGTVPIRFRYTYILFSLFNNVGVYWEILHLLSNSIEILL